MTFLDNMLARRGATRESIPRNSRVGKILRRDGVPACSEWERINALPRRTWHDREDIEDVVDLMTEHLRTPQGSQRLWAIQAIALIELADCRGLIGGVRVSGGKTLISFLGPTVLEAQRPMIFVPAKSIKSGKIDKAYREAQVHWRVHPGIQFVSYEQLQTIGFADLLERYLPDFVGADEAHKWGRYNDTARTARAQRYFDMAPNVPVMQLSGTLMAGHVIKDVATICEWSLKTQSPIPLSHKARKDWADALEAGSDDLGPRMKPGALSRWCLADEASSLEGVRRAFGRRYTQTPGVVVSSGDALGQSLVIDLKLHVDHDDAVERAFITLRGDAKTDAPPKAVDGWILIDAPVIWTAAQTLELGFAYVCDPRPPDEWTLARQNWAGYCRERIKVGDIDTELQVANECRANGEEAHWSWLKWIVVRDTFRPNVKPVWLSDRRVDQAAAWLKKHKGLCWSQFTAFSQRLSEKHGVPFFGPDASTPEGDSIVEYPGGPAVVSIKACSEDLNLQDRWHANLVVAPPSTGQAWEQFLARTHRFGQAAPEVTCEAWIGCVENYDAIEKAREKERTVALASLDDARKLLVADWNDAIKLPAPRDSARWRRTVQMTREKKLEIRLRAADG